MMSDVPQIEMTIHKILPKGFAANCYLITADGKTAVAIDPAQPRVLEEAEKRGLKIEYVLLTHGHFDHIGGCAALQNAGAKVGCLKGEEDLVLHHNLKEEFRAIVPPFIVDFTYQDGDILHLCGIDFKVIATPGHTSGGACYALSLPSPSGFPQKDEVFLRGEFGGKVSAKQTEGGCLYSLFTGDTLFAGTIGRTDLPTGSEADMQASLKKLCALEQDYQIYPGHGENATLSYEKTHNGYIKW